MLISRKIYSCIPEELLFLRKLADKIPMYIFIFISLFPIAVFAQLDSSADSDNDDAVSTHVENSEELGTGKSDRLKKYNFKMIEATSSALSVEELCKYFYGQNSKPGKKYPVEKTEDIVVINCYNKGSPKLKQIPILKKTLEHYNSLTFNEKCKASSTYHEFEMAEIVTDTRNSNDLYERYFVQTSNTVSVRCRSPLITSEKQSFFKEKTQHELLIEALKKQILDKKKENHLKKIREEAPVREA